MNFLAEGDRARARQDIVNFVVALVQVRRTLRGFRHMYVGDAALAARHDPLNVAERAVDGLGIITMVDEGLLFVHDRFLFLFLPILTRQPNRIQVRIAGPAFHYMIRRLFQGPAENPVQISDDDAGRTIDAHIAVDVDGAALTQQIVQDFDASG